MAIWCVKTCGAWDISKGRFEITTSFSSGKKKKKKHCALLRNTEHHVLVVLVFSHCFFITYKALYRYTSYEKHSSYEEPQMEQMESLFICNLTEEGQTHSMYYLICLSSFSCLKG